MHTDPGSSRPELTHDAERSRAMGTDAAAPTPIAAPGAGPAPADQAPDVGAEPPLAPDEAGPFVTEGIAADRLAELRRRVLGGVYDSPAVADEIARRLLQSGDL